MSSGLALSEYLEIFSIHQLSLWITNSATQPPPPKNHTPLHLPASLHLRKISFEFYQPNIAMMI